MAFHWHGYSFSIPPRALHVAQSDGCDEQAFVFDIFIIGLQFHLESTEQTIADLIEHCGEDLGCGRYIQDPYALAGSANYVLDAHVHLSRFLDNLVRCSAAQRTTGTLNDQREQPTENPALAIFR